MSKTQTFNDGRVKIYGVTDVSLPGKKPVEGLELKHSLNYEERTVGTQRYNLGLQNGIRVDILLRCPLQRDVYAEDVAEPNDGEQYTIKQVQHIKNVEPPSMDISLQRLVSKIDTG